MKLMGFPFLEHDSRVRTTQEIKINAGIQYTAHTPLKNWNMQCTYYEVSDEDAVLLKLQYPDLIEFNPNILGPYDEDEVKIICHRCGGGLFSVSGHEWKTDPELQTYSCKLTPQGKCKYDA